LSYFICDLSDYYIILYYTQIATLCWPRSGLTLNSSGDLNSSKFCSFTRSQWLSVLFFYKISMTVGFVPLWDFNDNRFWSIIKSWQCFFFCYEISMSVGFVPLQHFNDSQFYSVTRFQWWSDLLGYEISTVDSFVLLWDFNDGWFCSALRFQWWSILFDLAKEQNRLSLIFCNEKQKWQSLRSHKGTKLTLRYFSDGLLCSIMTF